MGRLGKYYFAHEENLETKLDGLKGCETFLLASHYNKLYLP